MIFIFKMRTFSIYESLYEYLNKNRMKLVAFILRDY